MNANQVNSECDICMNRQFNVHNVQLDCNHVFCKECIDCWFDISKSKTCPTCRQTTSSVIPLIVESHQRQKRKHNNKQEIKKKFQTKMHEIRQIYKNSKTQKTQKTSITLYFGKDAELHGWKTQFQYEIQKLLEYLTRNKSTYQAPSNWMNLCIFQDIYELQNMKFCQLRNVDYQLQYIEWLQKKAQRALR